MIGHIVNEYSIQVLCVNETKLSSEIKDELLYMEGYKLYRQDRNRHEGGVAVYVIDSLTHIGREDLPSSSSEMVCTKIPPSKCRAFTSLAWYRPPSDSVDTFSCLEQCFSFMYQEDIETILIGDRYCEAKNGNIVYDNCASNLNEIYSTFELKQLIKEPTRVTLGTSSLIGRIAKIHPINIAVAGVHKICLSDHHMIFCVRKFQGNLQRNQKYIKSRQMQHFNKNHAKMLMKPLKNGLQYTPQFLKSMLPCDQENLLIKTLLG